MSKFNRQRGQASDEIPTGLGFGTRQIGAFVVAMLFAIALVPLGAQARMGDTPRGGPFLTFAPSTNGTYDYGMVEAGQTAFQRFTLTNSGTKPTSALSLAFRGSRAFRIISDTCTLTDLHPGRSCTFEVSYTSSAAGATDTGTVTATAHTTAHKLHAASTLRLVAAGARHIYWTTFNYGPSPNCSPGRIGRAKVDGTNVNPTFIATSTPLTSGITVDSSHIYWSDLGTIWFGRANLNGSNVDLNFLTGLAGPAYDLAVDSSHLYWTEYNRIARAGVSGTNVFNDFITGLSYQSHLESVAVNSSHIYWADTPTHAIGRANLNGSNVDPSFIEINPDPGIVGVAVNSGHIYWTQRDTGAIGRANLDGTNVDPNFITGLFKPDDVAVDSGHIYWTEADTIARANLNGTAVDEEFIIADCPRGVAVDAG
jgi:hypothetical protein